jgi:hypothetical protein
MAKREKKIIKENLLKYLRNKNYTFNYEIGFSG